MVSHSMFSCTASSVTESKGETEVKACIDLGNTRRLRCSGLNSGVLGNLKSQRHLQAKRDISLSQCHPYPSYQLRIIHGLSRNQWKAQCKEMDHLSPSPLWGRPIGGEDLQWTRLQERYTGFLFPSSLRESTSLGWEWVLIAKCR